MTSEPRPTRWAELAGDAPGDRYAARLAELAATGVDMHGEATFCTDLVAAPAGVLDAGCGTGRVAIRLAELGYRCVGVDCDESMLAVARRSPAPVRWLRADLAGRDPLAAGLQPLAAGLQPRPAGFELVLAAGNVIPLLAAGTLPTVLAALAGAMLPPGYLVTGFGLAAGKLPAGCPVTPLPDYDDAAERAGLTLVARYAGWQREPFTDVADYAVSVHRQAGG